MGHEAGRKGLCRTTKEVEMKDLKERAIKATKLFLERCGYEVIETGWECPADAIDVVATDDETLVFVEVLVRTADEGGFPEGSGLEGRGHRETAAIAYLAEHEDVDRPVRFDDVSRCCVPRRCLRRLCVTSGAGPRTRCADGPNCSAR